MIKQIVLVLSVLAATVLADFALRAPNNVVIWHQHEATDKNGVPAISLLVPSLKPDTSPHLYVISSLATVATALKTVHLSECSMKSGDVAIAADVTLVEALTTVGVNGIECDNGMKYYVNKFEKEDPRASWRQQANNGATPAPPAGVNSPREYPYLATEILGNTILADIAWLENFIAYHWGPLHAFPTYVNSQDTGIYSLSTGQMLPVDRTFDPSKDAEEIRVGMSADWGAGTREADYVQSLMTKDYTPHFNIHIGDVYYVGTPEEVQSNVLGIPPKDVQKGVSWPHGTRGTFALNGNHEMYSRGLGYFDHMLPSMGVRNQTTGKNSGQKASFFSLENAFWRVIALDTGYNTYSAVGIDNKTNVMPQSHVDWLIRSARIADSKDTRPIIFMSHHQYYSAWENGYDWTPKQIAQLLPSGRVPLWIWGHEHRLSFYDKVAHGGVNLTCYARCIGVGGFPTTIQKVPKDPVGTRLMAYDNRLYVVENGTFQIPVGYNGFTRMTFKGPYVQLDYYSLQMDPTTGKPSNTNSTWLVSEVFTSDNLGNVVQKSFTVIDKGITVVTHVDEHGNVLRSGDNQQPHKN